MTRLESRDRDYWQLNCPDTVRATIAKSLVFSLLSYAVSIMFVPVPVKLGAEHVVFRSLWNSQPNKVETNCEAPRKEGKPTSTEEA